MQVTFEHQEVGVRQEDTKAESEAAWADGHAGLILATPECARHGRQDKPPQRGDALGRGK